MTTPKSVREYYEKRQQLAAQGVTHELAIRESFKGLLENMAKSHKWTLVVEQKVEGATRTIRPDGTLRDVNTLPRGYWEAKDTRDDLDAEIRKKFERGYPATNIIFEDTRRAVLYQSNERVGEYDLTLPEQVATLMQRFFSYTKPVITRFEQAVERFKTDTRELASGLLTLIENAHKTNKTFKTAFEEFFALCQHALNPNISREAVNEMLIQHLLTERLMRTVFDNPEFTRRNVIAAEVEKVIVALTSKSFSRDEFMGQLGYFYEAIEAAAQDLVGFTERQNFINTVYERFFQGYAVNVADTHGIVYTPQPIVDFMCAAVEEVLKDEFGYTLDHPDVCMIDPCTGTGNFIINLLHRVYQTNPAALPEVYQKRLFANEVMLLPYYVASLNIEHAYYELMREYESFEGLCFVDTLDLAESAQLKMDFMTVKNSQRVERQKKAKITVVIGNPPYNVGQLNENDNNKNRKYDELDKRIHNTYAKDSKATLNTKLYDPYVKFFKWATDRLNGSDGVVCFVSNNSFVDQIAFDGMRKHLLQDFTRIYHIDLHGNVRQNPKLSGTTHNVFGIQVGVGITVAVRNSAHQENKLFYYRVPEFWRKEEKLHWLTNHVTAKGRHNALNTIELKELVPDTKNTWRVADNANEFEAFLPLGTKEGKSSKKGLEETIFKSYSLGVSTNRDSVVYDFNEEVLAQRIEKFCEAYNAEVDRYKRKNTKQKVDDFVNYENIKWSSTLKNHLKSGKYVEFDKQKIQSSLYRPFSKQFLYYDRTLIDRPSQFQNILLSSNIQQENKIICVPSLGNRAGWTTLIVNCIPNLAITSLDGFQCFPFYVYDENGENRRENITDWALSQFRSHYADETISKWDIFYYVYGLLHHPTYRTRYADNLKRELPRLPFASDFWAFSHAGKHLADLHLNYETIPPHPLEYVWAKGQRPSYRVEKMRLNKNHGELVVNETLTLKNIPLAALDYKLGNRSALEWVVEQYQVKIDKRSGITSDPNQYSDDEKYIVELVGRVVAVSLQTLSIVQSLPSMTN